MTGVLALLMVNALLGAWDTIWYHEYRANLTAKTATTRPELRLHVGRDVIYTGLYGLLAFFRPEGLVVSLVVVALVAEIVLTLSDFVVEDRDRPAIGGMAAGERVLHSLMAIVYGAMLSRLVPELLDAAAEPTGLAQHGAPVWLSIAALVTAAGIAVSGLRDALALRGVDPIWGHEAGTSASASSTLRNSGRPKNNSEPTTVPDMA